MRYVKFSVTEFQEAFQLFDSRGDGKIHVAQIGDALRALGQNPTESDVKKCTLHLKPDERISFEVFLPIYQVLKMKNKYLNIYNSLVMMLVRDEFGNYLSNLKVCFFQNA